MKKKKLKAELSKTKKKLVDAKAELKAVKTTPKALPKTKVATAKPNSNLKSVAAKSIKPVRRPTTKTKTVRKP